LRRPWGCIKCLKGGSNFAKITCTQSNGDSCYIFHRGEILFLILIYNKIIRGCRVHKGNVKEMVYSRPISKLNQNEIASHRVPSQVSSIYAQPKSPLYNLHLCQSLFPFYPFPLIAPQHAPHQALTEPSLSSLSCQPSPSSPFYPSFLSSH
jgi:hypothetical protein